MFINSIIPQVTSSSAQAFAAANQAMAELFTAGCIGTVTVRRGYINPTIVQSLSKTCFSILLPMFLSTSIMTTVNKYGLDLTSLAMPIIAVAHCISLFFISRHILLPLFDIDLESVEGKATNICCAFGNAGVVPLIFVEALFRNSDGDILQRAISQVSLYLLGWSPFFWSFGRNALLDGLVDNSHQGYEEGEAISVMDQIKSLKSLFPPPVVGVCIGLFLSIPLFRNFVITYTHQGITKKAPFQVVFNCCQNFGRAANPLALLVLTSSLALGNSKNISTATESSQQNQVKRWCCVSLARFALSPLLMLTILNILQKLKVIGSINSDDAMSWFILMLQATMPCAQNSVLMLQVSEKTSEASRLAKFLFVMYATSMIPVVFISTILLEKCNFMI